MSTEKRWVIKPQGDPEKVAALAAALGIAPVLANLLVQRGIETEEDAWRFFNPKLENLHDPFLMKGMDRAVRRIDEAVQRQEPIMVYGDYDVDGTTAVAMVYSFCGSWDTLRCCSTFPIVIRRVTEFRLRRSTMRSERA